MAFRTTFFTVFLCSLPGKTGRVTQAVTTNEQYLRSYFPRASCDKQVLHSVRGERSTGQDNMHQQAYRALSKGGPHQQDEGRPQCAAECDA